MENVKKWDGFRFSRGFLPTMDCEKNSCFPQNIYCNYLFLYIHILSTGFSRSKVENYSFPLMLEVISWATVESRWSEAMLVSIFLVEWITVE